MTPVQRRVLTFSVMLAAIMQSLDTTIANVSLPHMQGSMSAAQDQIAWVLTSYIVASAILMPTSGFLSQRFGMRTLLIGSILGFTISSMMCGAAQTLEEIVICRILQGMSGAFLVPMAQTILLDIYTLEERGRIMALWGMGTILGPVCGPALGGFLTENYSWRWVFYINVPIGAISLAGILFSVKDSSRNEERKLDWMGFAFLGISLGALQIMLDRANDKDWFSSMEICIEGLVAAFSFYLFIAHSLTSKNPFIDFRMFRDVNFNISCLFMCIIGLVLYATMALMAPFLQTLMGFPAVTAGLMLAPRGIGTMITMLLAGRLINHVDVRILVAAGLAISASALWEMTHFNLDVSQTTLFITGLVQGAGVGLVFVPLSTIAFSTLPAILRPEAASLFSLSRNIGSSVGISAAVALIAHLTQINHASLASFLVPTDPFYRPGALPSLFNPSDPVGLAVMNGEVTRQAAAIAYLDDFRLMMWLMLFIIPLAFLLKPPNFLNSSKSQASPSPAVE